MVKKSILLIITVYSEFISPLIPGRCRFYPTCSQYCYMAFDKYGVIRGFMLSFNRIRKCHPFHTGGYDPLI